VKGLTTLKKEGKDESRGNRGKVGGPRLELEGILVSPNEKKRGTMGRKDLPLIPSYKNEQERS